MNAKVLMFSLTACLALAVTAEAQPGGGGGRGRGGFGGGGGMFGGGSIFRVASNDAVQKELGLSDDAIAKVKTVVDGYSEAARPQGGGGGFQNFQNMSEDERRAAFEKMQETRKAAAESYLPKLKDALSADQFTRVQQIYWQSLGMGALNEAEVIKGVSITQAQQDKIKAVNTEFDGKRRELFQSFQQGDREQNREKMQQMMKDQEAKTMEVLTKDQQDKFASLKGKAFDLSELRGGRGGPGGGPGGSPGGGGGDGGRQKRPQPKVE